MDRLTDMAFAILLGMLGDAKISARFVPAVAKVYVKIQQLAAINAMLAGEITRRQGRL